MTKYELDAVEVVPERQYNYKGYKLMKVRSGIPPIRSKNNKPVGKYERLVRDFLSREDLEVARVYVQGAKPVTVATHLNLWKKNHPEEGATFRVVTRQGAVYLQKL